MTLWQELLRIVNVLFDAGMMGMLYVGMRSERRFIQHIEWLKGHLYRCAEESCDEFVVIQGARCKICVDFELQIESAFSRRGSSSNLMRRGKP